MPALKVISIALMISCALFGNGAAGDTYYVSTCGDDAWSGTEPNCVGPNGPKATIQEAIDSAEDGDEIVVRPGTYSRINFRGKAITVRSVDPGNWEVVQSTIISGGQNASCVVFDQREERDSILEGFTLTGGGGDYVSRSFGYNSFSGNCGGGVLCINSSPTIRRCNITGNGLEVSGEYYPKYGGGVGLLGDCQTKISNCFITENISKSYGSGIYIRYSNMATSIIINSCTIANNYVRSGSYNYEVDCHDAQPIISNTIIWGRYDGGLLFYVSPPVVQYSCVKNAYKYNVGPYNIAATGHNISVSPRFVGYSGDYHLRFDSPCISAGDPNYVDEVQRDIDGQPRVMEEQLDMGADEAAPAIVVERPAGGEIWQVGSTHGIEWKSYLYEDNVDIFYSVDGGDSWSLVESGAANTGSYMWLLPEANSSECLVGVEASNPPEPIDYVQQQSPFTIKPALPYGVQIDSVWPNLGRDAQRSGLSETVGPQMGCVKWRFETDGPVYQGVTIGADNNVHIPCRSGRVYTVDTEGDLLWIYDPCSPVLTAPAVGPDGTICFGCADGKLYAVNKEGQLRWTHGMKGIISSTPAVGQDGKLFFGAEEGTVWALDPDGTELWSYAITADNGAKAAVAAPLAIGRDGAVYVGGLCWPVLYALDPNTGQEKWSCDLSRPANPYQTGADMIIGSIYAAPVVVQDGTIYVSLVDNPYLYAVEPEEGNILWSVYLALDPSGWSNPDQAAEYPYPAGWSAPALGPDGTIYVNFDDAYLRAVNPDGSIKWIKQVGMVGGFTLAVGGDGLIYAAGDDGSLYVLNSQGEQVARFSTYYWSDQPSVHWKLDETSGIIAHDSVGDRDGTLLTFPIDNSQWVQGEIGGALQFDGNSDYVIIEGYNGVTGSMARRVSAWIKTSVPGWILSWGRAEAGKMWMLMLEEGGRFKVGVWDGYVIGTTILTDNQWHHVEAVFESDGTPGVGDVKLYVDDKEETISAVRERLMDTSPYGTVLIGAYSTGGALAGYFNGLMDDIRIFVKENEQLSYPAVAGDGTIYFSSAKNAVWAISAQVCAGQGVRLSRPADFSEDGEVNLIDFAVTAANWLKDDRFEGGNIYTNDQESKFYLLGDVNRDRLIDFDDLEMLVGQWLLEGTY